MPCFHAKTPLRAATLFVATLLAPVAIGAPNIALVVIDDLNNYTAPLRGFEDILPDRELQSLVTPNLGRLAELGTTFVNAQASQLPANADLAIRLVELLKANGYALAASGEAWKGAVAEGEYREHQQGSASPHRTERKRPLGAATIDGKNFGWNRLIPTKSGRDDRSIEAWERLVGSLDDHLAAAWAAERIASHGRQQPPQLVAVQLSGASPPWKAAGLFFDRFPPEKIRLPSDSGNDRDVLPELGKALGHPPKSLTEKDRQSAFQAYLAGVSSVDFAVGALLGAVERANTDDDPANDWTLALWSSGGFQLGQKGVWGQESVWEPAAHINLMVYAPGVTKPGQRIDTPVELRDLPPTIAALAGAAPNAATRGHSLLPLITQRGGSPGAVALTTLAGGSAFGLRSQRFRLVQYADGSQELYDHEKDPDELTNLLHPGNAAKVEAFGLSANQVEAVRGWLSSRLEARLDDGEVTGPAPLPGDFNGDGSVDAADSTVWRDHLGMEVPVGTDADGDYDGRVEDDDRNVWLNNYGRTARPAADPGSRNN